ncbi:hypothetical protein D3C71_1826140 [compost metagenome]
MLTQPPTNARSFLELQADSDAASRTATAVVLAIASNLIRHFLKERAGEGTACRATPSFPCTYGAIYPLPLARRIRIHSTRKPTISQELKIKKNR